MSMATKLCSVYSIPYTNCSISHQNRTPFLQIHQLNRSPSNLDLGKQLTRRLSVQCSEKQAQSLRTCKNCKTQFDPMLNNPQACRFHSAHFGGIASALMTTVENYVWTIDTGASDHMVNNKKLLRSCTKWSSRDKRKIFLQNDEFVVIDQSGVSSIFTDKQITNVLYVPEFKYNLLSVSKLTKELNCLVTFYSSFCVFEELSSGKILGIGKEDEGLYTLKADIQEGETRRKFESVHSGGTMDTPDGGKVTQYWHCCGSEDPFDPGCTAAPHAAYDD